MSNAREIAQLGSVPSGRRNLIINGAMNVTQRGTSFTAPASGSVICDRWTVEYDNDASVDWSQSTDAPDGFSHSLKADVTTADTNLATAQYSILYYKGTEVQDVSHLLYGTSGAKKLTMSFWVKSNKTGTYSAELAFYNGTAQVEHSKAYTINTSNTWEKKELTFDANTTDSFGRAANGQGLIIYFWLAAGSQWQGSPRSSTWGTSNNRATDNVNFLDSTSNEFYITGVQLEVGSVATEFENRSYGEELALCQRYYHGSEAYEIWSGYAVSGTNNFHNADFKTTMRAIPSLTLTLIGQSGFSATALNTSSATKDGFHAYKAATATGGGKYFYFTYTADAEL